MAFSFRPVALLGHAPQLLSHGGHLGTCSICQVRLLSPPLPALNTQCMNLIHSGLSRCFQRLYLHLIHIIHLLSGRGDPGLRTGSLEPGQPWPVCRLLKLLTCTSGGWADVLEGISKPSGFKVRCVPSPPIPEYATSPPLPKAENVTTSHRKVLGPLLEPQEALQAQVS